MASAYGHRREYRDWVNPYDVQMMAQVSVSKEQDHIKNFKEIQGLIDRYQSMDLVKDVDKAYLYSRLKTLTDKANKMGTVNLASNAVTQDLQDTVSQAVDDNIMTAYQMSQQYRNLVSTIDGYRKLGAKGGYADQNAMEAMEPANAWANDGKVGSTFVSKGYTPYVDYKAEQNKMLTEWYKDSETTIDTITPDGRKIRRTVKGMEASEVAMLVEANMSGAAKRQQQIDAKWFIAKTSRPEDVNNTFTGSIDGSIKQLKAQYDKEKDKNSALAVSLKGNMDKLEGLKTSLMFSDKDDDETRNQKLLNQSVYIQHNSDLNAQQQVYRERTVKELYEKDEVYWEKFKMEQDERHFQQNYLLKQEELALKSQANKINAKANGLKIDKDGNILPDIGLQNGLEGTDALSKEQQENVLGFFQNYRAEADNNSKKAVDDFANAIAADPALKTEFDAYVDAAKKTNGGNDAAARAMAVRAIYDSKMTAEQQAAYRTQFEAYDKAKQKQEQIWKKDEEAVDKAYGDIDTYVTRYVSNNLGSTFYGADSATKTNLKVQSALNMLSEDLNTVNRRALMKYIITAGGTQQVDKSLLNKYTTQGRVIGTQEMQDDAAKAPNLKLLFGSASKYYAYNLEFTHEYREVKDGVQIDLYKKGKMSADGKDFFTSQGMKNYANDRLAGVKYLAGTRTLTLPDLESKQKSESSLYSLQTAIVNQVTNSSDSGMSQEEIDRWDKVSKNTGGTFIFDESNPNAVTLRLNGRDFRVDRSAFLSYVARIGNEQLTPITELMKFQTGEVFNAPDSNKTKRVTSLRNLSQENWINTDAGKVIMDSNFNKAALQGADGIGAVLQQSKGAFSPYLADGDVDAKAFGEGLKRLATEGFNGEVYTQTAPTNKDGERIMTIGFRNADSGKAIYYKQDLNQMGEDEYDELNRAIALVPEQVVYNILSHSADSKSSFTDLVNYMESVGIKVKK